MGILSKLLSTLKVSTTVALAGVLAAGVLLFAPADMISDLGVSGSMAEWRPWIVLVFVGCAAVVVARTLTSVGSWVRNRWRWRRKKRLMRRRLHYLAADEKAALARYLLQSRKCLRFPFGDGVPLGLAAAGLLFRPSNLANILEGCDFVMQPWVWEYLTRHPQLVINDPANLALFLRRSIAAEVAGRGPWTADTA